MVAMSKVINYLQQPESIYALTALLLNTRAPGVCNLTEMIEWFQAQYNVVVNGDELTTRWHELVYLNFAKQSPRKGYILTEKGEKMTQALMDCISYIGKLQGGDKNTR